MKIKKRNLVILLCIILFSTTLFTYVKLQPLIDIQIKAHFHEKVIKEIMNTVRQLEVPNDFLIRTDKNVSVNTNQLNQWIIQVNDILNQTIDDEIVTSMPIGYLTGNVFLQNLGPEISVSFVVTNRITAQYDIKTTSLGINNALIELILNIECKGNIYLGIQDYELVIQERIPLALEYIQGDIPQIIPY